MPAKGYRGVLLGCNYSDYSLIHLFSFFFRTCPTTSPFFPADLLTNLHFIFQYLSFCYLSTCSRLASYSHIFFSTSASSIIFMGYIHLFSLISQHKSFHCTSLLPLCYLCLLTQYIKDHFFGSNKVIVSIKRELNHYAINKK